LFYWIPEWCAQSTKIFNNKPENKEKAKKTDFTSNLAFGTACTSLMQPLWCVWIKLDAVEEVCLHAFQLV
jgi:hypothetical protein